MSFRGDEETTGTLLAPAVFVSSASNLGESKTPLAFVGEFDGDELEFEDTDEVEDTDDEDDDHRGVRPLEAEEEEGDERCDDEEVSDWTGGSPVGRRAGTVLLESGEPPPLGLGGCGRRPVCAGRSTTRPRPRPPDGGGGALG